MASIEDFVQAPCGDLLDSYTKEQLFQVADYYRVWITKKMNKEELLTTLKGQLVESNILSSVEGASAPVEVTSLSDVASAGVSGPGKALSPVLSGIGTGLTFEQQKELLLLQLQHEQKNVLEVEKLRREARMRETELARVQQTQKLELERYKLGLISEGKLQAEPKTEGSISRVPHTQSFDVAVNLRLVPKFNEQDPDIFFVLFERLAEARDWSDAERTLLLQCVLTGKAQEAFSALSATDSGSYQLVKAAVLKAFELVPEAYRQRFRTLRKGRQSHTEFARDLATHFNRWCVASEVETLQDLQELILLEQFKNTLPDRVVTYLNEQKVKPSGAALTLHAERGRAIAAVQAYTKPSPSSSELAFKVPVVEQEQAKFSANEIDPGYAAFVSDGYVSLVGSDRRVPVRILRDSGALDSLIVDSVLPFSPETDTGSSVDVRGMGLTVFSVLLHYYYYYYITC
ncbi:unnamed protein product [Ophioblennius macclurei]